MVLHTLNATSASSAFRDCLRCAGRGDTVLLLGDGAYSAIDGSDACKSLQACGATVQVLEADSLAAGLDTNSLAFPHLDMDGFAALSEYYPRQLAWYQRVLDSSAFDTEGFLRELQDWSPAVAEQIAAADGIALTGAHWEVIELLRDYYTEFDASPAMRPLVKYCSLKLGADKGKSIYLLGLFPGSPAKTGSKIAGLPKPENCL